MKGKALPRLGIAWTKESDKAEPFRGNCDYSMWMGPRKSERGKACGRNGLHPGHLLVEALNARRQGKAYMPAPWATTERLSAGV